MLYLATQFAWFLLAAFALGFVMGWISRDDGKRELWNPNLGYVVAAWLLAAIVTWSQSLNGVAALWVESALVFLPVYAAGCIAGALLKGAREPELSAVAAASPDGVGSKLGEPKPLTEAAPMAKVMPVADDAKTVIAPKAARPRSAKKQRDEA